MQIGRPLMSDSAATDNFARPLTRERTEFGFDPDFSSAFYFQDTQGWEKSIPRPARKFAIAATLFGSFIYPGAQSFQSCAVHF